MHTHIGIDIDIGHTVIDRSAHLNVGMHDVFLINLSSDVNWRPLACTGGRDGVRGEIHLPADGEVVDTLAARPDNDTA